MNMHQNPVVSPPRDVPPNPQIDVPPIFESSIENNSISLDALKIFGAML